MKKLLITFLIFSFLILVVNSMAVTEDGIFENGDVDQFNQKISWSSSDDMDVILKLGDTSYDELIKEAEGKSDEELKGILGEIVDKINENLDGDNKINGLTVNINGNSVTGTANNNGIYTSNENGLGKKDGDGIQQTGVEGAYEKDVTGNSDDGFVGLHWGKDNNPPDEPEGCVDTPYGHSCAGDAGVEAKNDRIDFSPNISPDTDSTKENPLNYKSEISIFGTKHIDRLGDNPYKTSGTCTGYDGVSCSKGEHDESYPCGNTYTDWGTPSYKDEYHGVKVTFNGFRVGKNKIKEDIIANNDSSAWQDNSRPELSNTSFNKKYIITDLIDEELTSDTATGLFKGSVTVSCLCSCVSNNYDLYFKITGNNIESLEYTLTVISDGEGKVGIEDNALTDSRMSYKFKTNESVLIKAQTEGKFVAWYEANEEYYSGNAEWYKNAKPYREESECNIIMPGYDLTLIARFIPKEAYKVTVISSGNGTVKIGDRESEDKVSIEVEKGTKINISANPYKDEEYEYEFLKWDEIKNDKMETYGYNQEFELEVDRDYIIIAYFNGVKGDFVKLTVMVDENGGGYTIPSGTIDAIPGNEYSFGAYPEVGFNFYWWKEEDNTPLNYGQEDTIIMPDHDYTLIACFTNGFKKNQLVVESNGGGTVALDDNEYFRLKDSKTVANGVSHTIKAKPDANFEFTYWQRDDGLKIYKEECIKENDIYTYDVAINDDELYVAYFKYNGDNETHRLIVNSGPGGEAKGNVDNAVPGVSYRIEAIPDVGHEFRYWMDDEGVILGTKPKEYIKMKDRDYVVTAYFKEIISDSSDNEYELTIKKEGEGTTIPSGTNTYTRGDEVVLKATPEDGYRFDGWYEDYKLLSTLNTYTIYMYNDRTLIARFVKNDSNPLSSFKIISIRDLRWKDYFVSNNGKELNNALTVPENANSNTVLVKAARLIDSSYNSGNRDVVYGYAVEFELITAGIECDVTNLKLTDNPELLVTPSVSGIEIPDNYKMISSKNDDDIKGFMVSALKTYDNFDVEGTTIEIPIVTWRWVYYLPLEVELDGEDLTVKFDIKVKLKNGSYYDYIKAIKITDNNNWGGKVFTYRTDITVLDDIYNNANN